MGTVVLVRSDGVNHMATEKPDAFAKTSCLTVAKVKELVSQGSAEMLIVEVILFDIAWMASVLTDMPLPESHCKECPGSDASDVTT